MQELTSDQIYNLDNSLSGPLGDTPLMDAFRKEHHLNRDYFIETREERNSGIRFRQNKTTNISTPGGWRLIQS